MRNSEFGMRSEEWPYVWRWRKYPTSVWGRAYGVRQGMRCRVLVRGRTMNTALVEFEDGTRFVTSRNGLRKADGNEAARLEPGAPGLLESMNG